MKNNSTSTIRLEKIGTFANQSENACQNTKNILCLDAQSKARHTNSIEKGQDTDMRLLTTKDVCELLQIGRNTLINLRNERRISFIKWDNKVYFRPSDIISFIEGLPRVEGVQYGY
ncbi:helix-turn-helix domain-containing protein [Christensenellaceae bacterium OttesenSCG-928-L17]|nr:helix-turn-helix domain-containing protein [Christensenellaceae bacterium OttesenSCG-928-L17]